MSHVVKTVKLTILLSRSAAELDELFERKVKPWRFAKAQTATQRVVGTYELNEYK